MSSSLSATERRWRNRPLVRERDRGQLGWLWRAVTLVVLVAAPTAAYLVWQNTTLKLSYEIGALQQQQERLIEEERRLRVERARLAALPRIESWALRGGGLERPTGAALVVIPRERTQNAAAANGRTERE